MSTVESPKIRIAGNSGCVVAFAAALQDESSVAMKRVKVMVLEVDIVLKFIVSSVLINLNVFGDELIRNLMVFFFFFYWTLLDSMINCVSLSFFFTKVMNFIV